MVLWLHVKRSLEIQAAIFMDKNLIMSGMCCKISQAGLSWIWFSLYPAFSIPQEPWFRATMLGRAVLDPAVSLGKWLMSWLPLSHLLNGDNSNTPLYSLIMSMWLIKCCKTPCAVPGPSKGQLMWFYKEPRVPELRLGEGKMSKWKDAPFPLLQRFKDLSWWEPYVSTFSFSFGFIQELTHLFNRSFPLSQLIFTWLFCLLLALLQ